jgi:hypothetical protein
MGPITDSLFQLSFHDCPETALFFTKKKKNWQFQVLAISGRAVKWRTPFYNKQQQYFRT